MSKREYELERKLWTLRFYVQQYLGVTNGMLPHEPFWERSLRTHILHWMKNPMDDMQSDEWDKLTDEMKIDKLDGMGESEVSDGK